MDTGLFVVLDGLDAAGKATQSKILAKRLNAELYSFPRYDTPIGKLIKRHLRNEVELIERIPTAVTLLVTSPRGSHEHVQGGPAPEDALMFQCLNLADKIHAAWFIQDHLLRGANVVCDRWIPSAICYGLADGLDRDDLFTAHGVLPQADLNIFLDITPEEALRRRPEARDRYERDREKQKAVRAQYEQMWAAEAGAHYVKIDGDGGGSGDGPIAAVAERIWAAVEMYRKERE